MTTGYDPKRTKPEFELTGGRFLKRANSLCFCRLIEVILRLIGTDNIEK
jgi:hypothetical protein